MATFRILPEKPTFPQIKRVSTLSAGKMRRVKPAKRRGRR